MFHITPAERGGGTRAMPPPTFGECFYSLRFCVLFVCKRITRWHYFRCSVMITRWRYCLIAAMITRWHYCIYFLFIYYVIFTQEYPISAQHCSPWGSCITCMTKTNINQHTFSYNSDYSDYVVHTSLHAYC